MNPKSIMNDDINQFFFNRTDFEKRQLDASAADSLSPEHALFLLEQFALPPEEAIMVHVAGTNGKGSVCFYLEQMLLGTGASVAVFSSPHLHSVQERFRINGRDITDRSLRRQIARIEAKIPDTTPFTAFEMMFLTALLAFKEAGCRYWIIETGVGGRRDTTNCIKPHVSIITSISFDHMDLLGSTLPEIAAEKAGIIKPGIPCITSSNQRPEVLAVLKEEASRQHAPLHAIAPYPPANAPAVSALCKPDGSVIHTPMASAVQGENFALADKALQLLGFPATPALYSGLKDRVLPGRIETVSRPGLPVVVLDTGHNRAAITGLLQHAASLPVPRTLLFGALKDKDPQLLLSLLAPAFDTILVTEPASPRAATIDSYHPVHIPLQRYKHPQEALQSALLQTPPYGSLTVAGSFYLTGQIRELLHRAGSGSAR